MREKFIVRENLIVPPPRWAVARQDKRGCCCQDIAWFWCLKDAQDYEAWRNGRKKRK